MMALTADMSSLVATGAVTCVVPFIAITVAALFWRQLRSMGFMEDE